jgi:DNA polymerase-3 subunit gamma/tau
MSMSFATALQDLAALLQKIAMAQLIPNSVLPEWPEAEAVEKMAKTFSKEEIQLLYQIAITSRADLHLAPEEEIGFSMALLRMLAFKIPDSSDNQVIKASPRSVSTSNQTKIFDQEKKRQTLTR